ncbi:MAG: caspase family protein, partial [Bacteroidota bacterium]
SDACHSGGISVGYATRGLGVTESNLINQYLTDLSRSKEGVVVFTASAAGEVSQEYPELGHGVFTYYLLEGVRGAADFNNDYTVTINELMQYVEEQVKRKTRGSQNPTRSQTSYDKDLTISLIPH